MILAGTRAVLWVLMYTQCKCKCIQFSGRLYIKRVVENKARMACHYANQKPNTRGVFQLTFDPY